MTAEAAVAVPALVVFAMALVWALMAASAQIQCVDAARAGARAAARSEPQAAALAAARAAAPSGAVVILARAGDLWRVRVEADTPGPRGLALTLSAEAAALAEDSVGQGPGQGPARVSQPADAGENAARADVAGPLGDRRPMLARADRAGRDSILSSPGGVSRQGKGADSADRAVPHSVHLPRQPDRAVTAARSDGSPNARRPPISVRADAPPAPAGSLAGALPVAWEGP